MRNDIFIADQGRGFSIVELMTILTIAGILLAVGIPSFHAMIQNQRLTTTANDLFMAVNLTRSEAIRRGARVDLIPAGVGTDWADGWVVFVDGDHDQRSDAGETVIFSHGPVNREMRIKARFTDSKVQYIAYDGSGRSRTNANSQTAQSGNWLLELGPRSRKIVINFMGRPRVCDPHRTPSTC